MSGATVTGIDGLVIGRTRREDLCSGETFTRTVELPARGNVLVTGDAGSGKTVLARTLLAQLAGRDDATLYVLTNDANALGSLSGKVEAYATTTDEQRALLTILLAKARRRFERYSDFQEHEDEADIVVVVDGLCGDAETENLAAALFAEGRLVGIHVALFTRTVMVENAEFGGTMTSILMRQSPGSAVASFPSHYDGSQIEVVSDLGVGEGLIVENYGVVTRFRITPTSTVRLENVLQNSSYHPVVGTPAGA